MVSGREWVFGPSRPVTLGRLRECDVQLVADSVSRRHGELRPEAGGWYYVDLDSSVGTWSGGAKVERVAIKGVVTLRLGTPDKGAVVEVSPVTSTATPVSPAVPRLPPIQGVSLGVLRSRYQPQQGRVRIGRAPDNDVVVEDMLVSRHHAELVSRAAGFEVVDLGSHNGTFLDGRRLAAPAAVTEASIVGVGRHSFRLVGASLEEYVDAGRVTFDAVELSVQLPDGRRILDQVSFPLDQNNFLAVLGPTGAGKSTLTKALTGFQPATSGRVLYNGRDLYESYEELRRRVGYVPQDDILHPQLDVRRALQFSAALRFPPDVSEAERDHRVDEVLDELGLTERAGLAISSLSGGQRKRTSVALELLTKPSLLFLDEPTSGLDPYYEKSVMELLRNLADGGRTVVVITHSIQSLALCDRLLFLAPGGSTAYFGPPDESLDYFGAHDHAEVFHLLESDPPRWRARFSTDPARRRYVDGPLAARRPELRVGTTSPNEAPAAPARPAKEFSILGRRYLAVIAADRRNARLLLAQAPIVTLLIVLLAPVGALGGTGGRGSANTALLALVLGATFIGESNAVREIVKELPVYRRERAVGLSVVTYLASKAAVLGVITVAQAALLVFVGTLRQKGPNDALTVLGSAKLELFVGVALAGVSAMALGLLLSALVSNTDKAVTLLPVILLTQFLLAGPLFDVSERPVLRELSYLSSTRWGYAAAAATADLRHLPGGCDASPRRAGVGQGATCDALWRHDVGTWMFDVTVLVALTIAPLVLATVALRRRDPLRTGAPR
jgi:ABC-type multidrug transport system ATPase subunit/pSer/pThr/pTyr-binding forkhead associated (FHA) protein